MVNKIIIVLSVLLLLVAGVVSIIYKFENPDFTNTRIFLNIWPVFILFAIGLAGVSYFVNHGR